MNISEDWKASVTAFVEKNDCKRFEQILLASVPELTDNTLKLRIPGKGFPTFLPTQKLAEQLKAQFSLQNVSIVPDDDLAGKLIDAVRKDEVTHPVPETTATESQTQEPVFGKKYFSIEDHLSEAFHANGSFLVTPANKMVYYIVQQMADGFPKKPEHKPFMISAGIGMGKTHLMQHFAWQLVDKIKEAGEYCRKKDFVAGRKLLSLPDDTNEILMWKLLRDAASSKVRYVTAEEFVEEHILSTNRDAWKSRDGNFEDYKRAREKSYLGAGWLFLDDIHAFAKGEKESTLEYAYKIADSFYRMGGCLVAATDTPPKVLIERANKSVKHALERLFSRFYAGGVYPIENTKKEDLASVLNHHLKAKDNALRDIAVEELEKGSFFSVVKSYRDAESVASTAHNYVLQGLPFEAAIKNGIDALKTQRANEGNLF